MSDSRNRQFQLPLAELVDRLTVDQIKEVLHKDDKHGKDDHEAKRDIAREIAALEHDIDLLIVEHGLRLSARLVRVLIVLAQMNVHIWYNKELMGDDPRSESYLPRLQLSHQLNGIRNQMKNLLLAETGERDGATLRANFNTDRLEGWDLSLESVK